MTCGAALLAAASLAACGSSVDTNYNRAHAFGPKQYAERKYGLKRVKCVQTQPEYSNYTCRGSNADGRDVTVRLGAHETRGPVIG